ncbi:MAG: hypothetical protein AB7K36_31385 [Chloroflexota bacterium]
MPPVAEAVDVLLRINAFPDSLAKSVQVQERMPGRFLGGGTLRCEIVCD